MDELEKIFESAAEYFGLLSEPSRLKIMHCLCDGVDAQLLGEQEIPQ